MQHLLGTFPHSGLLRAPATLDQMKRARARLNDLSWKTQYSVICSAPDRKTPQKPPGGV